MNDAHNPASNGVRLRPLMTSDALRLSEIWAAPEVARWVNTSAYPTAEQYIAESLGNEPAARRHDWAITRSSGSDELCGLITLHARGSEWRSAEVGYAMHPAAAGSGLAKAALREVCERFFARGGESLAWWCPRDNVASWAVARSCGFAFRGVVPSYLPYTGSKGVEQLRDAWLASLDRGDAMTPRMPWVVGPPSEHARLRFRQWRDDDAAFIEAPSHPQHFTPASAVPTPENFTTWRLEQTERVMTGMAVRWCIADADTDLPLGGVGLHGQHLLRTPRLGYWLLPSAQGRGVAKAAARVAADYALRPTAQGGLGAEVVGAQCAVDNPASIAVLRHAGFTECGRGTAITEGITMRYIEWERTP